MNHQAWFYKMDDDGETPYSRAFKSQYPLLVQLILQNNNVLKDHSLKNETCIGYWGYGNKIKDLLKDSPIIEAIKNNDISLLEELINSGENINEQNKKGMTPLHVVAMTGNIEIAKLLLKNGAIPNVITSKKIPSPANIAFLMGYSELSSMFNSN